MEAFLFLSFQSCIRSPFVTPPSSARYESALIQQPSPSAIIFAAQASQDRSNNRGVPQTSPSTVISAAPTSQDRPHVCQHCSAAFSHSNSLKKHLASFHRETWQVSCPESVRHDGDADNHGEKNGRQDRGTVFQQVCDLCSKVFTHPSHLERDSPAACDVCSKAFHQDGNLGIHTPFPARLKPFTCDTCGKAFFSRLAV